MLPSKTCNSSSCLINIPSKLKPLCPFCVCDSLNVSTTPIAAMGCWQCLPISVVQLKGKRCRKPHCCNGVVDTSGPILLNPETEHWGPHLLQSKVCTGPILYRTSNLCMYVTYLLTTASTRKHGDGNSIFQLIRRKIGNFSWCATL